MVLDKKYSVFYKYLDILFKEANKAVNTNSGGPFSAIILENNKILSKAHNQVIKKNDPSAHAEILAIRKACNKKKNFSLKNTILLSLCEPCSMCLSAIMWAKIPKVYYYFTRDQAADIGFDDSKIYNYFLKKTPKIKLKEIKVPTISSFKFENSAFNKWKNKSNKIQY